MNNLIAFTMKYQKKNNRAPNRSCYTPVERLRLARNHTSHSATSSGATGLLDVDSTRGTTIYSNTIHTSLEKMLSLTRVTLDIFWDFLFSAI